MISSTRGAPAVDDARMLAGHDRSPPAAEKAAATFLVVSRGRADLLTDCLSSLERCREASGAEAEIVVVLNGGGDDVRQQVATDFPRCRLVTLDENRGFTGGVRAGLSVAGGEWIALINDDATVAADYLDQLMTATHEPSTGSVAAQMRFAARPDLVNSAGIELDRLGVAVDRSLGMPVAEAPTEPHEVFGACGGAALFRRAMLEDVGGLDERFFAYLEDVDLAWRARARGWQCVHVPKAIVWHHHSASLGHGSSFKHYLVGRNRVRLLAKNASTRQLLRSLPRLLMYDLAYVIFACASDRTLAPVRGRIAGLREWRQFRRSRQAPALPVSELANPVGIRQALQRRRSWAAGGTQAEVVPRER